MTRINSEFAYKSLELSLKDVDTKSGVITGYFAKFDNIDSYYDRIKKGAFLKTIKERGPEGTKQIKHLLQHDSWTPIGNILVLKEDNFGLYFESQSSKTEKGQETLTLYAEGIYNEHSIGYRSIKETRVEDENGNFVCWDLEEIKLWEGSTVTWGANSQTPFTGFKSDNPIDRQKELDKQMNKFKSVLKLSGLTDETYESAELELTKLISAYKSLIEPIKPITHEPMNEQKELRELLDIIS